MRDPHRPKDEGTDKTDLNGDSKRLIVRVDGSLRRCAGFAGRNLAKFFRDRTGAVTEDRRGSADRQRFLEESRMFANRCPFIGGKIIPHFIKRLMDPRAQIWRGKPGAGADGAKQEAGRKQAAPTPLTP